MKRAGWIASLCLALPLAAGCPADDSEEGDEGSNTSGPSSESDPSSADGSESGGDDSSAALGCAAEVENDTTDGASDDLQLTWGAPCTDDAECIDLLGEGGVCLFEAVIYELPLGYCSKSCELPSGEKYVFDDPACDPNGGIDCIGLAPLFQVCAPQCTDDAQCSRDGYSCRNFPMIAEEGDPTYCLMPDCCEGSCAEE
ncbi:MAG: hypothetical protein ACE37F_36070 [Nannocystaceae bacterium]|nr:hypothetical protein [bacterium]